MSDRWAIRRKSRLRCGVRIDAVAALRHPSPKEAGVDRYLPGPHLSVGNHPRGAVVDDFATEVVTAGVYPNGAVARAAFPLFRKVPPRLLKQVSRSL